MSYVPTPAMVCQPSIPQRGTKKKKKKKKKNKELYFGSNGTDEDDAGPACSGS